MQASYNFLPTQLQAMLENNNSCLLCKIKKDKFNKVAN